MNTQDELNQDELNQDELSQDELSQDELSQEEMNQDELIQYEQDLLERYLNHEDNESDDEDPLPKWNIPNWKGNVKEAEQEENIKENKCLYCVTRITPDNERRGCAGCDEYWDMPDLILQTINANNDCVGCELLDGGEGGENQLEHTCMGY